MKMTFGIKHLKGVLVDKMPIMEIITKGMSITQITRVTPELEVEEEPI